MKFIKKFQKEEDVKMLYNPNVVLVKEPRKILYDVMPPLGVYIQHVNGEIYTTDEWTANGFGKSSANGVAVIDTDARFVVGKSYFSSSMLWSSDTKNLVEGISGGRNDYAGKRNTALIAIDDTSEAAYTCANYVFPNGQKGYLPAAGECGVCWRYKEDLNKALTLIGGAIIADNRDYWTSTQISATTALNYNFYSGVCLDVQKNSTEHVRPFTTL
jgi:hypothetical protein